MEEIEVKNLKNKEREFGELLKVIATLRVGCPWDKVQTTDSLRTMTIEEVYELCDAIILNDTNGIKEELGDVLMHLVFYAHIAEEKGEFDVADVIKHVCDKLKYRHPHIYGDVKVNGTEDVLKNWEQLKLQERGREKKVLQGVPASLPALIKATRIQQKAHGAGFDWKNKEDVWAKVKEELNEFEVEVAKSDKKAMEEEMGDIFFSMVNAARLYGINPEDALEKCNQKFLRRFSYIEEAAKMKGKLINELSLQEMDELWNEKKRMEKVTYQDL